MTAPIDDEDAQDKPLDPAVERVRRKLMRFAVINLLILFVALAAVVGALIWRAGGRDRPGDVVPAGALVEASLAVPAGAAVVSHALSADAVSLLVRFGDGSQAVLVFNRGDGRALGRYAVATAP